VGLFDLLEAFRSALAAAPAGDLLHPVESEEITVRERMIFVMSLFEEAETVEFSQVFRGGEPHGPSPSIIVATFLAILELARLSALRLFQSLDESGAPRGEIRLRGAPKTEDNIDWVDRISESL